VPSGLLIPTKLPRAERHSHCVPQLETLMVEAGGERNAGKPTFPHPHLDGTPEPPGV